MVGILCLMPLLMSGEINSSNGVGIKDWTWKVVHCTDGDLISIDYVMTNNTPHKIINAQFEVILWGTSLTTILNNDSRQLAKVIRKDLDDVGYSFCPSNSVHKSGVDVALQKYMSSTVKSVSLTLLNYESVEMTFTDMALVNAAINIEKYEKAGKEVPDQFFEFKRKMLEKKSQSSKK